jgi:hypothetical protein
LVSVFARFWKDQDVKVRVLDVAGLFLLSALSLELRAQRSLAFERAEGVWVANLDGSGPKRIAQGSAPDLSPDGQLLAFNTE